MGRTLAIPLPSFVLASSMMEEFLNHEHASTKPLPR